ncbi:MAG TPA: acyl-CoA dehydrogenase family protein [Caulobacteraceae bacterium]|nr:acyl-CoA dehydrogenase family protein [Caulobacteraceae bacterium]
MPNDVSGVSGSTTSALERARGLYELISAEALEGERLGRLTDRVGQAMLGAGLFAMLLPRALGGEACSRAAFFETVEEVARADGSAGWCLSVCSAIADFTCRGATPEAVDEVFGGGPVAMWTSLLPRASSKPVDGGFRVSGAFSMGSGSAHARWVLVAAPLADRSGAQWFRAHILPKTDVTIQPDSWDVMGLRATTSIEYTIDDRFTPAHRTFEYPFTPEPTSSVISAAYGVQLNQIGLAAFAAGVARRAVDELLAAAPKTKRTVGEGTLADDNVVQFGVGELEGRLKAARAYLLSLVAEHDRHGHADAALALETSQAAQILTRAAREMVIFAFDYAGTKVIFAANPIQRCLRDIFTGLKHASFTPALLTNAGAARLGRAVGRTRLS